MRLCVCTYSNTHTNKVTHTHIIRSVQLLLTHTRDRLILFLCLLIYPVAFDPKPAERRMKSSETRSIFGIFPLICIYGGSLSLSFSRIHLRCTIHRRKVVYWFVVVAIVGFFGKVNSTSVFYSYPYDTAWIISILSAHTHTQTSTKN